MSLISPPGFSVWKGGRLGTGRAVQWVPNGCKAARSAPGTGCLAAGRQGRSPAHATTGLVPAFAPDIRNNPLLLNNHALACPFILSSFLFPLFFLFLFHFLAATHPPKSSTPCVAVFRVQPGCDSNIKRFAVCVDTVCGTVPSIETGSMLASNQNTRRDSDRHPKGQDQRAWGAKRVERGPKESPPTGAHK